MTNTHEHAKEYEKRDVLIKHMGEAMILIGKINTSPDWYNGDYTMCLSKIMVSFLRGRNWTKPVPSGSHLWLSNRDFPFRKGHSLSPDMREFVGQRGKLIALRGTSYSYVHHDGKPGVGFKVKEVLKSPLE